MNDKEWRKEQELRAAMGLARVSDISIHEAFECLATFRSYERKLQRLAELSCNGYPMPKIEYRDGKMYSYSVEDVKLRERCEKRESKIEHILKDIAEGLGVFIDFQGDPRGLMFSLKAKSGQDINYSVVA